MPSPAPLGHAQLVKWSLPAFALILGLLWYKRRRADRVDPGGAVGRATVAELVADGKPVAVVAAVAAAAKDSGAAGESPSALEAPAARKLRPAEDSCASPRKVSESLAIPNRRSSSLAASMLSRKSLELVNPPWYEDEEEDEEEEVAAGTKRISAKEKASSSGGSVLEEVKQESCATTTKIIVAKRDMNTSPKADFESCCSEQPQPKSSSSSAVVAGEERRPTEEKKSQQQLALSERDSANHSPVSAVLDGSVNDEARSEGSTDSGKGGSINGHRTKDTNRAVYEFLLPDKLVGKMIGKRGKFVHSLRTNANVSVCVRKNPIARGLHVCCVEGLPDNITHALELIREHFPEKFHPSLTLEPIAYEDVAAAAAAEEIAWVPELLQLGLVEGVNNDVIVSHIVSPCHFFVQLPTHPTYPSLRVLDEKMTRLYGASESPPVPDELSKGMIVVANWYDKWVRVYIENPDPEGEKTLVRLVDHGGYYTLRNSDMRKIRSDYLTLPFQAIEVFLANVKPKGEQWSEDACNVVGQICNGMIGQAQIVGYVDCSTFISLYFNIQKHGVISLADELVARGLADPLTLDEVVPQEAPAV